MLPSDIASDNIQRVLGQLRAATNLASGEVAAPGWVESGACYADSIEIGNLL